MTGRRSRQSSSGRKSNSPPSARNHGNHNHNNNNYISLKTSHGKTSSLEHVAMPGNNKPRHATPSDGPLFDALRLPTGRHYIYYVVIATVSFVIYSNSLQGDFVHDDVFAIKNNKDILPSTPLSNLFRNDFWGKPMSDDTSHKSYRPLCVLTFRLNYLLSGHEPFYYHLWNVCLHAVVCVTFTFVTHHVMFADIRPAFISALLFAVHPIHTEAVAGVVGRADVLSCLFFLLAFLAYSRCLRSAKSDADGTIFFATSIPHLALTVLLSLCALLVKEHAATILGVCLAYDAIVASWPVLSRRNSRVLNFPGSLRPFLFRSAIVTLADRIVMEDVVLIVLLKLDPLDVIGFYRSPECEALVNEAAIFLGFRVWMLNGHLPHFSEEDNPASFAPHLTTRFLTYSYLVAFNIWLLLCPATLSHDWQEGSIPLVESIWDPRNVATLLALTSLAGLGFFCIFKSKESERRTLACGLLFLAIPFLPASNLFIKVGFVVAERILYIPSLGFCILVAYGICKISTSVRSASGRTLLSMATLIVILCLARRTWVRNRVWESRETLFIAGLQTLPHNAKMHYNYGNYLMDIGQRDGAIKHFQETLRLYPRHASANNNLGTLLSENEPERAVDYFHEAIQINPHHARAYFNLANVYNNQGDLAKAESFFLKALEIDPHYMSALNSIASLKQRQGDNLAAEAFYRQGLEQGDPSADLHNNYAAFLMGNENHQQALHHYDKCLELDPTHVVAMGNKARLLRHLGRNTEAEEMYLRALSYGSNAKTLQSLAAIYYNTDRPNKAMETYREALRLDPFNLDIQLQYAQVLTRLGSYEEAKVFLVEALQTKPEAIELHRLLASVYSVQHRYQEALQHVDIALGLNKMPDVETKAELLFEKANHLKGLNRIDDAQKLYEEVLTLNPDMGSCLLNLGAIHHLKGEYQQARVYYMKALAFDPKNGILIENIAKLKRAESKAKRSL